MRWWRAAAASTTSNKSERPLSQGEQNEHRSPAQDAQGAAAAICRNIATPSMAANGTSRNPAATSTPSIPAPANRSARWPIAAQPTSTPRSRAAKAAFAGWRDTPPLERARLLKRIAKVLRDHAEELALIDAADCGNPFAEMVQRRDDRRGADRILCRPRHRDEGLVDPDGTGRGEFLRARAARRGRPHHSVQSSLHVLRRQGRRAARRPAIPWS